MVIQPPKIGVVILNYNTAEETLRCLRALRAARGGERRVWVVDNGSTDGSQERIPGALAESEVFLETGANLGYAGGNNVGIREALRWGTDYVLLLNPDVEVEADFLPPLLRALEASPRAGMACPLVLQPDGETVQSLGGDGSLWTGRFGRRLYGTPLARLQEPRWAEVLFPHGACVLIRRRLFEETGLLAEPYFLYYEDVEFGLRARREGFSTLAIPQSRVRHADSTKAGERSPLVSYLGTRNAAWVVAQYGHPAQRLAFLFLSAYLRWPLRFLGRLLRGHFRAAGAVVRGAIHGQFRREWRAGGHLAVPWEGRRRVLEPLP
ncbi:MAG: glycosyltransferase family 2 protein [Acidobacteriota bacterium]